MAHHSASGFYSTVRFTIFLHSLNCSHITDLSIGKRMDKWKSKSVTTEVTARDNFPDAAALDQDACFSFLLLKDCHKLISSHVGVISIRKLSTAGVTQAKTAEFLQLPQSRSLSYVPTLGKGQNEGLLILNCIANRSVTKII